MEYVLVILIRPFVAMGLFLIAAVLSRLVSPAVPDGAIKRWLYKPRDIIPDYLDPAS